MKLPRLSQRQQAAPTLPLPCYRPWFQPYLPPPKTRCVNASQSGCRAIFSSWLASASKFAAICRSLVAIFGAACASARSSMAYFLTKARGPTGSNHSGRTTHYLTLRDEFLQNAPFRRKRKTHTSAGLVRQARSSHRAEVNHAINLICRRCFLPEPK